MHQLVKSETIGGALLAPGWGVTTPPVQATVVTGQNRVGPSTCRLLLAVLSLSLFLSLGKASAGMVVNIDINGYSTNTYTGQGAYITADAHRWNGFDLLGTVYFPPGSSPLSSGALVDSAGGATTVQVTLSDVWRTFEYTIWNGGSYATGNALIDDIVYAAAADHGNDGLFHTSFILSGLIPGAPYTLYLYGAAGKDLASTDFSVNSVVQTTTGRSSASTPAIFTLGADYTVYSSVPADGFGKITGYFKATGAGASGRLSGLQIVAVPEPCTAMLFGLSGLLLVRKTRKH